MLISFVLAVKGKWHICASAKCAWVTPTCPRMLHAAVHVHLLGTAYMSSSEECVMRQLPCNTWYNSGIIFFAQSVSLWSALVHVLFHVSPLEFLLSVLAICSAESAEEGSHWLDCTANVLCHGPKWALWKSAVSWTKECIVQYRHLVVFIFLCCTTQHVNCQYS